MTNTTETITTEPEFDAEAYLCAHEVAIATDCGFPDCDGTGHEVGDPAAWAHRLVNSRFDGAVAVEIHKYPAESPFAVLSMDAENTEWTAAELRIEADLYEAYPGWLRARADELDALND